MEAPSSLDKQAAKDARSAERQPEETSTSFPRHKPQLNVRSKGRSDADIEQHANPIKGTDIPRWKPNWTETMIMVTLAILSLMVSLDATVILTSLSVGTSFWLSQTV